MGQDFMEIQYMFSNIIGPKKSTLARKEMIQPLLTQPPCNQAVNAFMLEQYRQECVGSRRKYWVDIPIVV